MKIQEIELTQKEYPEKLRKIKNPPKKLYVLGDVSLLQKTSVAIVGSRKASSYGKKYASLFSNTISYSNIPVVSGLALGIDSITHQSAMEEKRKNNSGSCFWIFLHLSRRKYTLISSNIRKWWVHS